MAHLAMLKQARKFAKHQGRSAHWQIYAALSKHTVDKETVARMTLVDRVVLLERVLKKQVKHAGILLLNRGLYVEQALGIRAAFPEVKQLYFLLGFDKIVQILDPRYYTDREAALHALLCQAHLLVAPRGTDGEAELRALLAQPENRPFAHAIHHLPLSTAYRDISSTQARTKQTDLQGLPDEVADFLKYTQPYLTPGQKRDKDENDLYTQRTEKLQQLLQVSALL